MYIGLSSLTFDSRRFASADAVQALHSTDDYQLKDLGALKLRGRKEPIRAWAVERR